jgi:hypothetical protein
VVYNQETPNVFSFIMRTVGDELPQQFLRRVADEIDGLGAVDLLDIVVVHELRSPDLCWSASVYWASTLE